jgi:hypothetical protein
MWTRLGLAEAAATPPASAPNPPFADGGTDYDGDGLTAAQEYELWRYTGPRSLPLSYSAGLKRSGGTVADDVRDADSDGLGNWDELNGRMVPKWRDREYKETPYDQPYTGPGAIDPDIDGDGLRDGSDDQDVDGWSNLDEIDRVPYGYRVHPYNPCLPDYTSPTRSIHPPFDHPYPPYDMPEPLPLPPLTWTPPSSTS